MSLGCYGSRIDTDMHDDELLIALTIDDVKKIINTE